MADLIMNIHAAESRNGNKERIECRIIYLENAKDSLSLSQVFKRTIFATYTHTVRGGARWH